MEVEDIRFLIAFRSLVANERAKRLEQKEMYPYPENRELLIEGIRAPNAESAKNRNLLSTRPLVFPAPDYREARIWCNYN